MRGCSLAYIWTLGSQRERLHTHTHARASSYPLIHQFAGGGGAVGLGTVFVCPSSLLGASVVISIHTDHAKPKRTLPRSHTCSCVLNYTGFINSPCVANDGSGPLCTVGLEYTLQAATRCRATPACVFISLCRRRTGSRVHTAVSHIAVITANPLTIHTKKGINLTGS